MENALKRLFIVLSIFYAFLFIVFISQIWLFVILEIYMGLPVILPLTVMFYIVIDTFTPNRKHHAIYGWLYAEYVEHIVFPLILIFSFTVSPLLFYPTLLILIFYFYGHLLGEIKKFEDAISLSVLMILFVFLLWFPDIVLFINAYTNMGKYIIITFLLMFVIPYAYNNYRKSCQLRFNKSMRLFFKTYPILIATALITAYILLL